MENKRSGVGCEAKDGDKETKRRSGTHMALGLRAQPGPYSTEKQQLSFWMQALAAG
jgi:hypothetical protein